MKWKIAFVAAVTAGASFGASAQNLKPGLWEITHKMQGGGADMAAAMADMQREMASMPPEQRKMMQEMMAKQGVQMGAGGPGGMSARVCMTKEMVERNEIPARQGDCRTTQQSRSGNTIKMAYTCTHPPSSGSGQVTIKSPEAYTMQMRMTSKIDGKSETMEMSGAGKWLSADCGSVKPMQPPKR